MLTNEMNLNASSVSKMKLLRSLRYYYMSEENIQPGSAGTASKTEVGPHRNGSTYTGGGAYKHLLLCTKCYQIVCTF